MDMRLVGITSWIWLNH